MENYINNPYSPFAETLYRKEPAQTQSYPNEMQTPLAIYWKPQNELLGHLLKTLLLSILTLGIYYFWGMTEFRRRIWSSVYIQNQPLEYTGRGLELFLGFLKVAIFMHYP